MEYKHQAVLLEEAIEYLNIKEDGIYLDGTLGRAGHSSEILKKLSAAGKLIAVDRDTAAIKAVREKFIDNESLILEHANFQEIDQVLAKLGIEGVDGMLFDLGVSSPQLDNPERGFSYQNDGPLDMRMNPEQKLTAQDIVNNYSQAELERIITEYGEENWAARIAEFIVKMRKEKAIETTNDLVEVIKAAIPKAVRRSGGHPARRTFQALRIETNNELEQLKNLIDKAVSFLNPEGRIVIITFHSLEDRIVKHKFRDLAKDCTCPPDFPICVCDKKAEVKVITSSPIQASDSEKEFNPRSRSAKMRVAEKI
ncbi:MAG: 16S rRNA (cytosine1402-N4)-methyltransferase [Halanaerobium sp. 4-GBenrich]|jgi:16S rRNA (cytosine1402-N4)-methyltransferase|uniref:Ribosomal RNA small subunit methyltransferase H n=1 Tax=Halanaerobium congolense TaxID=54121 RepID=A0A318EH41_9FIRM|nr:16S rRNA (cytosine(1402)-N(4))-methyltransferase RsmH [Halanaerobium congolense]KXS50259.1 MAG: 16S rRNA (cytosine1402-N4)-methyltransferase [Halanaerobium sp. T82-1]ODS50868.1 MAG: 16S rRNA (cytosine1402-N4)-methyltransferase [Halanaerobium sp. 4-GBenrich]PXV69996.1 16S rRNA (cytosine1402-N4)-methyltransferase [Halanaerobium congolense]TDX48193.1 16S rRNA (cytosine1402-N4)-methyltransferase [Halanaerobium congolense]SDH65578.1 16S rRNA (cytosine1402-N4)-methyltransferase [Halanaerobium con